MYVCMYIYIYIYIYIYKLNPKQTQCTPTLNKPSAHLTSWSTKKCLIGGSGAVKPTKLRCCCSACSIRDT